MNLPVEMFEHPATTGSTLPEVSMAEIEQALAGSANAATIEADPDKPIYLFSQRELDALIDNAKAQQQHELMALADPDRQVWGQTRYGRRFYPLNPRPEDIHLDDIAASLAKLCRYGGHCKWFYSVAEHSVHVAEALRLQGEPVAVQFAGLLHDATEGYLVDMPRPIKRMLWAYNVIEDRIWRAGVAPKFNLPADLPHAVKVADDAVLLAERAEIMVDTGDAWSNLAASEPAKVTIRCWDPVTAEAMFLKKFVELTP